LWLGAQYSEYEDDEDLGGLEDQDVLQHSNTYHVEQTYGVRARNMEKKDED
jgi:hypothetical protein